MAEYLDLGMNLLSTWSSLYDSRQLTNDSKPLKPQGSRLRSHSMWVDPCMFEVRNSVCVAGTNRDVVLRVKSWISGLLPETLAIESFHVKRPEDVRDGALLVPKVILAAAHRPGQKLLDHTARSTGQLDSLYDEICRTGGDVMIIYVDLPRCIYPPNKGFIYHQKISELLFPDQPLLKELALENELITVTEQHPSTSVKQKHALNHVQRNVIREWLERQVRSDHGVYRAAAVYLSDSLRLQKAMIEERYFSESETVNRKRQPVGRALSYSTGGYASASETTRRRSDDDDVTTSSARFTRRKRKSYGSVPLSSSTTSSGGRRRRRDDANEVLRPLMEDGSDGDDGHELASIHVARDNLGFARSCLTADRRSMMTTTYQL